MFFNATKQQEQQQENNHCCGCSQVKEAVIEAVGGWGGLVRDLWGKATSQVAAQCTTILQVWKL